MYEIYAGTASGISRSEVSHLVPYRVATKDDAAKKCVELCRKGYIIHRVIFPNGTRVSRKQLEHALKIGVESTRIALG